MTTSTGVFARVRAVAGASGGGRVASPGRSANAADGLVGDGGAALQLLRAGPAQSHPLAAAVVPLLVLHRALPTGHHGRVAMLLPRPGALRRHAAVLGDAT